ncbi:MAG TPA: hypothetical protein ENK55_06255 [Actinobacteria bacterium]|nr:hypothetical protein [Actinomycetota bacterium]
MYPTARRGIVLAVAVVVATGCARPGPVGESRPSDRVVLRVVDETGRPISGAEVRTGGSVAITGDDGSVVVAGRGPVAGRVDASGHLPEPVATEPGETTVRLWRRRGPDGRRRAAFHFGGDVMLGRRYLDPVAPGTAIVDPADPTTAREVVVHLAALFAAADASVVNVESAVGEFTADDAVPGKRYVIASPPVLLSALGLLGVDAVTLGNNHVADFGDLGIARTIAAFEEAGIAWTGAAVEADDSAHVALVDTPVGVLGIVGGTTVDGDFVNERLPTAASGPIDDGTWITELRDAGTTGFPDWPAGEVRAGDLWRWFTAFEAAADPEAVAAAWQAVRAVFPELQDWVARRGHGGARGAGREEIARDVAAARRAGADIVVYELHGGFQYADAPSSFGRDRVRRAVEAGADLVIGHHPHVLQGVEAPGGALVVHSLGNLLFDQDLLRTFPGAFLRTVVDEDGRVLEARFVPFWLDGYRPVPVVGETARRIFGRLRATSAIGAEAVRLPDLTVGLVPGRTEGELTVDDAGVVRPRTFAAPAVVTLDGGVERLDDPWVARVVAADEGIAYGRDLLGIGGFADDLADGRGDRVAGWVAVTADRIRFEAGRVVVDAGPSRTILRTRGRIPIPRHRLFDDDGRPLDGDPWYSFAVRATASGPATLGLRLVVYDVDDADPLRDPVSTVVRTVVVPVDLEPGIGDVEFRIPEAAFAPTADLEADAILPYLELRADRPVVVELDDVEFVEWRSLTPRVGHVVEVSRLQGPAGAAVTLARLVPVEEAAGEG